MGRNKKNDQVLQPTALTQEWGDCLGRRWCWGESLVLALVLLSGGSGAAEANVSDAYGLGSRMTALANAGVALATQEFAAHYNPAALSWGRDLQTQMGVGLLAAQPQFQAISGVVTQNTYTSDSVKQGAVDTNYQATLGLSLGVKRQVIPQFFHLSLGAVAYVPQHNLAYFDSGETFLPEYVLYRSRLERPQFQVGMGVDLGQGVHVGVGVQASFTLNTSATLYLNTQKQTVSTLRFASSLAPQWVPSLGVLYQVSESSNATLAKLPLTLGVQLRAAAAASNYMKLASASGLLGPLPYIDLGFIVNSALFYDPLTLELGLAWEQAPGSHLVLQADFQAWNAYQVPALVISQGSLDSAPSEGALTIAPGVMPPFRFQNLWIPRVAEEIQLTSELVLRLGYAYRGSFLQSSASEVGNYLDPPKHMLQAGLGFTLGRLWGLDCDWRLDLSIFYHALVTQTITKTPGNEVGNLTEEKIGAPGYQAGGRVWGAGVSVAFGF